VPLVQDPADRRWAAALLIQGARLPQMTTATTPEKVSGFAFGMVVERIAMLITDRRLQPVSSTATSGFLISSREDQEGRNLCYGLHDADLLGCQEWDYSHQYNVGSIFAD